MGGWEEVAGGVYVHCVLPHPEVHTVVHYSAL